MRTDLPFCSFKNCRHHADGNCTKPHEYEKCSRGNIFVMTEKVYEKYPHDNDVWLLLQEVARLGQRINRLYDEFELDRKPVYPWNPEAAGLDFGAGKEYNNFRENNEEGSTMRDIMCLCEKHPEKEQIFSLVKMLTEAGHPFYFNFYENLKPTPFGQEGNPETDIDWEKYHFLVEIGEPVEPGLSEISVCFNQDPEYDEKLLELVDARKAPKDIVLYYGLTAEEAMEYIEDFFKAK